MDLEKSLESSRKEYDTNMKDIRESSLKFQDLLHEKLEDSYKQLELSIQSIVNDSLTPLINKAETSIDKKVEDLNKSYLKYHQSFFVCFNSNFYSSDFKIH